MKAVTFEGSITEYQGKPVNPPINYSGTAELFENLSEAKASEDWPGDNEVLKMVNAKRTANARSAAYQSATATLKADYEKSPEFKLNQLVKALVATGKSETEARGIAESLVG